MTNLNRRIFFRHAGAFALGSLLLPSCNTKNQEQSTDSTQAEQSSASGSNIEPIGLQLYSVRDIIEQDLQGILQQLADIGYTEAEGYPGREGGHYFGMEPAAFSSMLKGMGMPLVSSHVSTGSRENKAASWRQATLLSRFDELLENAAETGQRYLTCSYMDESLRKTPEDLKNTAALFNVIGQKCKDAGLQFAYHNHNFEFQQLGDTMIYDFMLENTDPDLVKWELDMYWVVAGGQDPVTYLQKYPNRFPLGHVKDMDKADSERNAELGNGTIDYAHVLKVAKENGMEHFLVEQETYTSSPMESMKEDYQYLSGLTV